MEKINSGKFDIQMQQLADALERLKEVFDLYESMHNNIEYLRLKEATEDTLIQRFEFAFESYWKMLKLLLQHCAGEEIFGRRDVLKRAYQSSMISGENLWLAMLDDRNKLSHTQGVLIYDVQIAKELCEHIEQYYLHMIEEYKRLTIWYQSLE